MADGAITQDQEGCARCDGDGHPAVGMTYFPRSKGAKQKLVGIQPEPIRTVTLACGHETDRSPSISNPDRWYCCGAYQKKTRGRTPRAPMLGNAKKAHHGPR